MAQTRDRFAIARRYTQTMNRFLEKHPVRSKAELEMLADAVLMFATRLAFPTGSKFTFARQAQLCWDKYGQAEAKLAKMGAGALIHPEGAERGGDPGYVPICKGDLLVLWVDLDTYYDVVVVGFTKKRVRVKPDRNSAGPASMVRLVKPDQLGMQPDLVDTLVERGGLDDADVCRAKIESFTAACSE